MEKRLSNNWRQDDIYFEDTKENLGKHLKQNREVQTIPAKPFRIWSRAQATSWSGPTFSLTNFCKAKISKKKHKLQQTEVIKITYTHKYRYILIRLNAWTNDIGSLHIIEKQNWMRLRSNAQVLELEQINNPSYVKFWSLSLMFSESEEGIIQKNQ